MSKQGPYRVQKREKRGKALSRRCCPIIFCLLSFVLSSNLSAPSAEPSKINKEVIKKEKELQSLKKEIVEKKRDFQYNIKRESAVLKELNSLEQSLSRKEEELVNIEISLAKVVKKSHDVDKRILSLQRKKEKLSGLLEQRVVAMYKMQKGGVMQALFTSASITDFERRYKYISTIVDHDVDLLKEYSDNQRLLEAEKERLKELQEEMSSLKNSIKQKKGTIEKEKSQKETFLNTVRRKKEIQLAAIREMESASKELQLLLDKLRIDITAEERDDKATGFAAMRGSLPMPVNGKVIALFGKIAHPKFRTITFNNGIEIEAPLGAEVRSVYRGRVVYSGWFRGYGRIMIVDHGSGYHTLFAHLSKIVKDVDSIVEKGDIIALVGDTGSLKGAQLYFEIRQKGMPVDPLAWLSYRKK